jgi:hypothetical protein
MITADTAKQIKALLFPQVYPPLSSCKSAFIRVKEYSLFPLAEEPLLT